MTTAHEIALGSLRLGGGNPLFLIAGPCVIESESHARSMAELRSIVVGALLYPAVVVGIATILFVGMTYFIVPQFAEIFAGFGLQLPALTVAVFRIRLPTCSERFSNRLSPVSRS